MAPTILAINRNERRVEIKMRKDIDFVDLYLDLLDFLNIGYDPHGHVDKKGNIDKESFLEEDELEWCKKENFNFHIFFGNKKVIIVFESDENLQQEFVDRVCDNSEWLDPQQK